MTAKQYIDRLKAYLVDKTTTTLEDVLFEVFSQAPNRSTKIMAARALQMSGWVRYRRWHSGFRARVWEYRPSSTPVFRVPKHTPWAKGGFGA